MASHADAHVDLIRVLSQVPISSSSCSPFVSLGLLDELGYPMVAEIVSERWVVAGVEGSRWPSTGLVSQS